MIQPFRAQNLDWTNESAPLCSEGINETCIVTEYLGGSDLFNTIARPTFQLNENKCKVITGQILEALTFIHHLKIVHMDIKGGELNND